MGHPGGALLRVDRGAPRVLAHRRLLPPEGDQEVPQAGVQDGHPGRPRHRHPQAGGDDGAARPALPGRGAAGQVMMMMIMI